ncbi:Meteorin-like protein, partial [Pseudolycoriella hygida]
GLSNQHQDREIVSIDLRCSAGKIVWNYPRGAIRIILRSNIRSPNSEKSFRACLKVHKTSTDQILQRENGDIKNQTRAKNDLIKSNQIARIYLEAPKRLIALYDDVNDKQMVKCFRSIGGQVALYVEADKTPFQIMQTIFEYNLEFINNKRHSMQTQLLKNDKTSNDGNDSLKMNSEKNESNSWWMWWGKWLYNGGVDEKETSGANHEILNRNRRVGYVNGDEEIVGSFGESWEVCRPCSEEELVHAYCSSDIVTRGTIYSVQQQQSLDTVEITIKQTKILRDNMDATRIAEDAWRHHYKDPKFKTKRHRRKLQISNDVNANEMDLGEFRFHTPTHCSPSHGDGEFVFIGRKRFDEVMLICAPRLEEWAHLSRKINETNTAPCILLS